jgi:uncharacterized protein (DUF2336 family)
MADSPSAPTTLASLQKRAKELLELARDPSESARAALVSGLYDMSVASANVPTEDRTLAADIVLEIIKGAATTIRHRLAERLARDPKAPKALVLALARDEITVAFPVLIESPLLDEADLLEILRDSPPEHRLGTLQREQLSETVANAVVETRDPQVMRWLVENPGAKISPTTMETLVEAARAETSLQQSLVYRSDLPPTLASKMQSYLPDELRQELVARQKAKPPASAPAATPIAASPVDDKRALALARGLRDKGDLTIDLLVKTIRAGKSLEFEALFACFNRISLADGRGARRRLEGAGRRQRHFRDDLHPDAQGARSRGGSIDSAGAGDRGFRSSHHRRCAQSLRRASGRASRRIRRVITSLDGSYSFRRVGRISLVKSARLRCDCAAVRLPKASCNSG